MYPRTLAGCTTVLIFTVIASASSQERPIELKVLDRYVGGTVRLNLTITMKRRK